jgi:hypothetical protein
MGQWTMPKSGVILPRAHHSARPSCTIASLASRDSYRSPLRSSLINAALTASLAKGLLHPILANSLESIKPLRHRQPWAMSFPQPTSRPHPQPPLPPPRPQLHRLSPRSPLPCPPPLRPRLLQQPQQQQLAAQQPFPQPCALAPQAPPDTTQDSSRAPGPALLAATTACSLHQWRPLKIRMCGGGAEL